MSFETAHVCACGHFRVQHAGACRECDCEGFAPAQLPPTHARGSQSARDVAATEGAQEVARRSGGKLGVWTKADEELLSRGIVRTPAGDFVIKGSRA